MIVIVELGISNVGSIANMLKRVGVPALISSRPEDIERADKLILPGVGAFERGMHTLERSGLQSLLEKKVRGEATPLLGLCLGMQMLTEGSEEGGIPGLGWIGGSTLRFPPSDKKVPHMGWNEISPTRPHPLLDDLGDTPRFYFLHSYYVACRSKADVLATTTYGGTFHSIIANENILGVQFHPEKSHRYGMALLRNFALQPH